MSAFGLSLIPTGMEGISGTLMRLLIGLDISGLDPVTVRESNDMHRLWMVFILTVLAVSLDGCFSQRTKALGAESCVKTAMPNPWHARTVAELRRAAVVAERVGNESLRCSSAVHSPKAIDSLVLDAGNSLEIASDYSWQAGDRERSIKLAKRSRSLLLPLLHSHYLTEAQQESLRIALYDAKSLLQ